MTWTPGDFLRSAKDRINSKLYKEETVAQVTELEAYISKHGLLNTFNNLYILLSEKNIENKDEGRVDNGVYDELADKAIDMVDLYDKWLHNTE